MLQLLLAGLLAVSAAPADSTTSTDDGLDLEILLHDPRPLVADGPTTRHLDADAAPSRASITTGEALLGLTGVHGVRRGSGQIDPVLRGLSGDRVVTQLAHLPLHGACPGRMDPPVNMIPLLSVDDLAVVPGLASVALGAGGSGGRIVLDDELAPHVSSRLAARTRVGFDGARDATVAELRMDDRIGGVDARFALEGVRAHDYSDPSGRKVPSSQEVLHGVLAIAGRPRDDLRGWLTLNAGTEGHTDFPALPMDMRRSDIGMLTGGLRHTPNADTAYELRLGGSWVDHSMDNREKSNFARMEANTESEATSLGARLLRATTTGDTRWEIGLDATVVGRDARRLRTLRANGVRFDEHLWPDLSQTDTGAFAHITHPLGDGASLRFGTRIDRVHSAADASADPLGPGTVADAWVRFHGAPARTADDTRVTTSTNVDATWRVSPRLRVHGGTALLQRAPGIHELYLAYAPAPGGFAVGNPTLDTETSWDSQIGFLWDDERTSLRCTVYHSTFDDFVLNTTVAFEDVNGDGSPDRVRSFRNVGARRTGAEVDGRLRLSSRWWIPFAAHAVHAHNTTDDTPLPETPPVDGRIGLQWTGSRGRLAPWSAQLDLRAAAAQERVDTAFGEDETPGFVVLDLNLDLSPSADTVLRVGVSNLLDHAYHEHLTREVVLATADLAAGQEILAPGRALHASLGWRY